MRSTKDQLIKKGVLMPDGSDKNQDSKINVFLWNLPDVEEVPSHDGETILLWYPSKGKRNTYRCGQRTIVVFDLLLAVDYGMLGTIHQAYGGRLLFFRRKVTDPRAGWLGV
ncbi:hypothetical protein TNCV_4222801 [Trichonephila clavipes]|nr:hypothetical protein TNCV_4222801 [Trichonephila clavipes]